MRIVKAKPAPGKDVPEDAFEDITPARVRRVWWTQDEQVAVEFEEDLDDATARKVELRIGSANDVDAILRERLAAAMVANRAFLKTSSPSAEHEQVIALTKQVQWLIRRELGLFDATD